MLELDKRTKFVGLLKLDDALGRVQLISQSLSPPRCNKLHVLGQAEKILVLRGRELGRYAGGRWEVGGGRWEVGGGERGLPALDYRKRERLFQNILFSPSLQYFDMDKGSNSSDKTSRSG